jgi:hypothetical protein
MDRDGVILKEREDNASQLNRLCFYFRRCILDQQQATGTAGFGLSANG